MNTIAAIATASGMSAIAVVRVSGPDSHRLVCQIFRQKNKPFDASKIEGYKAFYGNLVDPATEEILDEAVVTFFVAPHSFTGEDSVEISVHGSVYIQQRLLELLVRQGVMMAQPGEFTRRAFVNRKFDLAQAEAVADLIESQSEASHRVAMNQLKGGFSNELKEIRSKLLDLTSLMELELDFSEEDVEFADRSKLKALLTEALAHIHSLTSTFRLGNAIKRGIPVAIVGETNTGKSTLLNALLGEERAIVSDIAGTTRDTIEEVLNIGGTLYRFIDTAGIRDTEETIERIGIERTYKKMEEADIVIGLVDATKTESEIAEAAHFIESHIDSNQNLILVLNKSDVSSYRSEHYVSISAKTGMGLELLKDQLLSCRKQVGTDVMLVTNMRHYEALVHAAKSLETVASSLDAGVPTDLVSQDLREALFYLGSITGEITTDEVLGNIFSRFCIGK